MNRRELIDLLTARGIEIPPREPRVRHTEAPTEITQMANEPVVETITAVRDYSRLRTIKTNPE